MLIFNLRSFCSGWEYKVAYEMDYIHLQTNKTFKNLVKKGQKSSYYTRSQGMYFSL